MNPDRPYYVLTRYTGRNGEAKKGRRTFRTRSAQQNYIITAPWGVAITAYN